MTIRKALLAAAATLLLASCNSSDAEGGIDAEALLNAAADSANWITYGRDYAEQRYSPLDQVNADTVGGLGLAWYADMDTARGQEATPLVIDGKLYVTTAWSKVKAYNAATEAQRGDVIPVEITVYEDRSFTFITKTPPAAEMIKKAAGVAKGSPTPHTVKVASLTAEQVRDIATVKMVDLNANDIEAAAKIIAGTARSMGITVKG